jgi:very-short-patch-repair endonuclease
MPHSQLTPQQKGRVRQLRQRMTRAETLLWRYIKAHRINGLGFRRQVPIRDYVADFVCHSARLIVEIDGETHAFQSRQRRDKARDEWFEREGYSVLRFTNNDVLKNLNGVVEMIRAVASPHARIPPSLSLPHKGGGNPQT